MKRTNFFFVSVVAVSVGVGILVSSIGAEAGLFDSVRNFFSPDSPVPTRTDAPLYVPAADYEAAIIAAVERASPAVVSVIVTKNLPVLERCRVSPFGNLPPEFSDFFGPFDFEEPCDTGRKERQEIGGGSGFIVSQDGFIVTNRHVVADEDADYTVLTNDGKKHEARVVARDPIQDLAIVKIESSRKDFPTVALAGSDVVKLGQSAIAIGNALGEFRNTVSVGIVSGLSRAITASGSGSVERLEGLIQTDAAINPGNSGGPLLNLRGEVIGVNTAVAEGAENIGFAIPVKNVIRDVESVRSTGKISLPFLGVRYILITAELADREKLSVEAGAIVRGNAEGPGVIQNSPAEKAGVLAEDIIVELGGEKISPERSLASIIAGRRVGETVPVKVLRKGKELTREVTLAERK
ncbi:MAG: trypsin-like peptidase domain-containing protein [Patescibacteria group bacterium]